MTRLRQPQRQVLDTLVDAGVARSRSEALAWCVRLVGQHEDDWLAELREAMSRWPTCARRVRPPERPADSLRRVTDSDPLARLAALEGVASGDGRHPRRDRRAAARPRPASYDAGPDRRVAAARGARQRGARGVGRPRSTWCAQTAATRWRRPPSGSAPSCSACCPTLASSPLQASPGCTRWPPRASWPTRTWAGRATPRAPPGCTTSAALLTRPTDGAGARGRRRRARRARDRRAVRVPQRARRPRRRAAGAGRARRRRQVADRAGGRATSRCAREYESNLRGYRDGGAGGRARAGCSTPPRPTPRAPRRARSAPLTGRAHMQAAPLRRRLEVPPLTHETDGYQACTVTVAPGEPGGRRPIGRVVRRVGTWLMCGS